MRYTVRHVTRFTYETPVTESVMEARMQPRSDGFQRCVHFALTTSPQARVRRAIRV
jgi:transglutaminase-like putative cysteine protease